MPFTLQELHTQRTNLLNRWKRYYSMMSISRDKSLFIGILTMTELRLDVINKQIAEHKEKVK